MSGAQLLRTNNVDVRCAEWGYSLIKTSHFGAGIFLCCCEEISGRLQEESTSGTLARE